MIHTIIQLQRFTRKADSIESKCHVLHACVCTWGHIDPALAGDLSSTISIFLSSLFSRCFITLS